MSDRAATPQVLHGDARANLHPRIPRQTTRLRRRPRGDGRTPWGPGHRSGHRTTTYPTIGGFLEALFRRASQDIVKSSKLLAPLLERFTAVLLLDSTTVTLPDDLQPRFRGCGGTHGGGQAAMKLQTQWDLRNGALDAIAIESGRDCDYKSALNRGHRSGVPCGLPTSVTSTPRSSSGSATRASSGFPVTSSVRASLLPKRQRFALLDWLQEQPGPLVDQPIPDGDTQRKWLAGSSRGEFLRKWPIADVAQADRRDTRKDGRTPTGERSPGATGRFW